MARYKFRLKTVQKVRGVRRDECRAALADAYRAERVLADQKAELEGEQAELRVLQRAAAAERYLDINRLVGAQRYELVLRAQQQELARQATLLSIETERRRQALVEAEREVRLLELLDERKRAAHRRGEMRREIKDLDEYAAVARSRGRLHER